MLVDATRASAHVTIEVDQSKSMRDQAAPGHNRWHPDVPAVATVKPGSYLRIECREWTDGQIGNNDSAVDVRDVNLDCAHMLSGPVSVEGAEPGDLLVVDILDLGPCLPPQQYGDAPGQGWGYTGIFAKENGGGFLTNEYPDAYKAIWDFHGVYASSRHIPGVKFAGITHPGLFGTAPSHELLSEWNKREAALIATDPTRVPPLGLPPLEKDVLIGKLSGAELSRIGREGARTVPARENGGNHDIKNFTRGARVYYPVWVKGGKLSGGDLHFSQGDGEITFCGAIEMGGYIDMGVDIIKGGMEKYGVTTNPLFIPGPVEPRYSTFLSFIGISVENGENKYLDATVAYRRACLNAVEYLKKFGYSGEQAYLLLGAAPIEGRVSGIVDIPNACCSLYLPTEIFDFDIKPNPDGPTTMPRGSAAAT
jgi:formamidase